MGGVSHTNEDNIPYRHVKVIDRLLIAGSPVYKCPIESLPSRKSITRNLCSESGKQWGTGLILERIGSAAVRLFRLGGLRWAGRCPGLFRIDAERETEPVPTCHPLERQRKPGPD